MHKQLRTFLLVVSASVLVLAGVFAPIVANAQAAQDQLNVLYSAGFRRTYTLHLPANDDLSIANQPKVPLVLVLHGTGAQGADAARITGFDSIADRAGFIVAYPDALVLQGAFRWVIRPGEGYYDIAFIQALMAKLEATYPIDTTRVYIVGMSNGGYFTYVLGCLLAGQVTAIATVIGGMERTVAHSCQPVAPLPLLMMTGTADLEVPMIGDALTLPADDIRAVWLKLDGCTARVSTAPLPDSDPNDGTTTLKSVWADCAPGVEVIHYVIAGGQHSWPGYASPWSAINCQQIKVCPTLDFSASEEIWAFFAQHRRN